MERSDSGAKRPQSLNHLCDSKVVIVIGIERMGGLTAFKRLYLLKLSAPCFIRVTLCLIMVKRFNIKFACVIKIYNHNDKYSAPKTLGPSAPD